MTRFPPGRHAAPGRLAAEFGELLVDLVEDRVLVLHAESVGVLMGVSVEATTKPSEQQSYDRESLRNIR
jgi:hypothetical protein